MIVFTEELVILDDIKISITNTKINSTQKLKFYYWLNTQFLMEGVGKVHYTYMTQKEQLGFNNFVIQPQGGTRSHYEYRIREDFDLISSSVKLKEDSKKLASTSDTNNENTNTRSKSEIKLNSK